MTTCPDCDATVDPDASYCGNCGAELPARSVQQAIEEAEAARSGPSLDIGGEDAPSSEPDTDEDVDGLEEMSELLELKRQQKLQEIEAERRRLEARDDVDPETLATLDDVDATLEEIAEIQAEDDISEERLADQEQFREELKEVMESSMDRMERLTEHSIDQMSGEQDADDTETQTCPNCDHEQAVDNGFCANCGRVLD